MTMTSMGGGRFSHMYGGPSRIVKSVLYATCVISLFCGLFDRAFTDYLGTYSPHYYLGLSWAGIQSFFLWQPISFLFVHHGQGGLSLGFLIELLFNMYLLWMMGTAVAQHLGDRAFVSIYLASGVMAGLASLAAMALLGSYGILLGAGPAVYGILAVWATLFPEQELILFFSIRVRAKWLFVGLITLIALMDLSQGQMIGVVEVLTGALTGYLLGIIGWDLRGPWPILNPIEGAIASLGSGFRARKERTQEMMNVIYRKAKVYDFKTGEAILDDEEFMDAMLTKISKFGEKSLTRKEMKRMREISKRKSG